jgi:hypothetical protein
VTSQWRQVPERGCIRAVGINAGLANVCVACGLTFEMRGGTRLAG